MVTSKEPSEGTNAWYSYCIRMAKGDALDGPAACGYAGVTVHTAESLGHAVMKWWCSPACNLSTKGILLTAMFSPMSMLLEMLSRWPRNLSHGPAMEMWSVVHLPLTYSSIPACSSTMHHCRATHSPANHSTVSIKHTICRSNQGATEHEQQHRQRVACVKFLKARHQELEAWQHEPEAAALKRGHDMTAGPP